MFSKVVEAEISSGAVEPGAWGVDIFPMRIELEERVLDNILGDLTARDLRYLVLWIEGRVSCLFASR